MTCTGGGGAVLQVAGPPRPAAEQGSLLRRVSTAAVLGERCPGAKPFDVLVLSGAQLAACGLARPMLTGRYGAKAARRYGLGATATEVTAAAAAAAHASAADVLVVSMHNGKRGGQGAVLLLCARTGAVLRHISGGLLDSGEPNMLAVQW